MVGLKKISHGNQSVAWFIDMLKRKQLILDPPYQRKSVWTPTYRRFFIDTIFRDYPAPPVFLNEEIDDQGIVKYYVIDGRQRLESIFAFFNNEIALPENFGNENYNGKYFNELAQQDKNLFFSYQILVEIFHSADETLIKETFDRFNRNVVKLNAQELRHASFDGVFITLMEELSEEPFWIDIGVSIPKNVRRMKDVEFISELFLLTMHGINSSGKGNLDSYYANYDEEIPNETENRRKFNKVIKMIEGLGKNFISQSRFSYYSDLYSLWAALILYLEKDINYEATKNKLKKFLDEFDKRRPTEIAQKYLSAIKSQPNNIEKRKIRTEIISKFIVTK